MLKTIVGVLDWKLSMQDAIALPNIVARGDNYSAETDGFAPGVAQGLLARGVNVGPARGENSGLHGVLVLPVPCRRQEPFERSYRLS